MGPFSSLVSPSWAVPSQTGLCGHPTNRWPAKQSLLAFLCSLQGVVSAAQAPSVRRVELGVGCVLSFLLVIRKHAVLRRSLCATLTALIDPLAAPSGAIAYGLTPCPVFRPEVMWIGLLRLRLDRSGVQGGDPGAQCVQVRHRSRSGVRRDFRGAHCAAIVIVPAPSLPGSGCAKLVAPDFAPSFRRSVRLRRSLDDH